MQYKQDRLFSSIKHAWLNAFFTKGFIQQLLITLIYVMVLIIFLGYYFLYLETRKGAVLNDWLLNLMAPKDLSNCIFGLLYSAVIFGLLCLLIQPLVFLRVFQTAAIVYTIRVITLYIIKLDPPAGFIPLVDPVADIAGYGGKMITKDLFFSGHTASLLMLFLAMKNRWLKLLFFTSVICMAIMLLWQHVHYTIDILGGIFFTLSGWWYTGKFCERKADV